MKNNKKKTIYLIIGIVLVIVLAFALAIYYITSTVNNYSYSEKNWISENSQTAIDVYVEPNLPIFSDNGEGVFHDYLKALKNDTGLTLNVMSSDTQKVRLMQKSNVDNNDIVVYKDHYVILSKTNNINKLSDINGKRIGVITSYKDLVSYYLTDYNNITYLTYDTFDAMNNAYNTNKIDYIIVPMYKYLDDAIANNLEIAYHLDGLYSYYTISIQDNNEMLSSIMHKFYNKWESKANDYINEYFLDVYFKSMNYTELQKEEITNDDFTVGYMSNLPFEGMIRSTFTGITSTYLDKFSDMTGVTYKYKGYDNIKELSSALDNEEVDIILNYYSLSNDKYESTRILGNTDYVVLANASNNIVINSLYSLVNTEVVMLSNMNLKYNMASKNLFEIKDYSSIKTMSKNIDKDSIIIVEKEVYDYYKDSYLSDYSIRFMDNTMLNNSFLLDKKNTSFNRLFDFYLSTLSSNEVKNESVENIIIALKNNKVFNFIMTNLFFIVVILLIIMFVIYMFIKKKNMVKKIKKEDRLYYFDAMTNLKNRNYLNDNINLWSLNKVYPQTIIIIDINDLKQLNERKGHEVGDNQIRAVSNILIKTQRDNSEIMRTDGDEFMIYLVGYEDKQISSYMHKLTKEFNSNLPDKDYGVTMGFCSIKDELTSIDDAISEAIVMIKKNKENR
mgnify:FL=1